MNDFAPHFCPGVAGVNSTAIVLSCPGQKEMRRERPVVGATGSNLDKLLKRLNVDHPDIFASRHRYDYRITNASKTVHYVARDGGTEATDAEILDADNLERLRNELAGCSVVLAMGERAAFAIQNAGFAGRVIRCDWHTSMQRLNRSISTDIHGTSLAKGESGTPTNELRSSSPAYAPCWTEHDSRCRRHHALTHALGADFHPRCVPLLALRAIAHKLPCGGGECPRNIPLRVGLVTDYNL